MGPFIYRTVVFAGLWDWILWGQLPDGWSVAGAVLVGAAGILAIRHMGQPVDPETGGAKKD